MYILPRPARRRPQFVGWLSPLRLVVPLSVGVEHEGYRSSTPLDDIDTCYDSSTYHITFLLIWLSPVLRPQFVASFIPLSVWVCLDVSRCVSQR